MESCQSLLADFFGENVVSECDVCLIFLSLMALNSMMEASFMNRLLTQIGVLLATIAFVLFQGCNSGPDWEPRSTFLVTEPNVGSTYTYNDYETEEGVKIDSTEQTVTVEVFEKGFPFKSKVDVLRTQETGTLNLTDTTHGYLTVEDDNNVSFWLDFDGQSDLPGVDQSWMTLPFATKVDQNLTLVNTIEDDGSGGKDTFQLFATASWVREETVQFQGNDLKISVCKLRLNGTFPFPFGGQIDLDGETDFYFAPEIGYVYKIEENIKTSTDIAEQTTGSVRLLTSYTLK